MLAKRYVVLLVITATLLIGMGLLVSIGMAASVAQVAHNPVVQIAGYTWSTGAMYPAPSTLAGIY
jgi:hypothetical protein